jgi:hypothetical protein
MRATLERKISAKVGLGIGHIGPVNGVIGY